MKKLLFACSILICVASCSGSSTDKKSDDATLTIFSSVIGTQALSVDTVMYYYSPEYRLKDINEPITVNNILSQSDEMKETFLSDMSQRKPFEIFKVIAENDTVYVRYCRGFDDYGNESQVLKAIDLDRLYIPAEKFESVLAELQK